jgi:hypothetical protein
MMLPSSRRRRRSPKNLSEGVFRVSDHVAYYSQPWKIRNCARLLAAFLGQAAGWSS